MFSPSKTLRVWPYMQRGSRPPLLFWRWRQAEWHGMVIRELHKNGVIFDIFLQVAKKDRLHYLHLFTMSTYFWSWWLSMYPPLCSTFQEDQNWQTITENTASQKSSNSFRSKPRCVEEIHYQARSKLSKRSLLILLEMMVCCHCHAWYTCMIFIDSTWLSL